MTDTTSESDGSWSRKDLGYGVLFAVLGALLIAFVGLSFARGSLVASPLIYVVGGILGVLFLVMGLNGIVRSLRAKQVRRGGPGPSHR